MTTAVMGYALPFGQDMLGGATAITNLLYNLSTFNRIGLWRALCNQSNIEEVQYISCTIPVSSWRFWKY